MTEGRRPQTTAVLTVLGWNILPLIGLTAWLLRLKARPIAFLEFRQIEMDFALIVGLAAIVAAAGVGIAIATTFVSRRRNAGWTPYAFGWGTLSAVLGWLGPLFILAAIGIFGVWR
jgi:hypothetical protein